MEKDFDGWNEVKKRLHNPGRLPSYREREIWWCSLGVNIGHEEDGKNVLKNRPVLVIQKFNRHIFLDVPLSTQVKNDKYYFSFSFKEKTQCALLSQISVWDARRLDRHMGKMFPYEFEQIRQAIKNML